MITAGRELEIGKAAEFLVCADLILQGHRAFLTDQGLPYDVVFDHFGRLFRVQVKCTTRAKPTPGRPGSGLSYMFNIRKAGKGNKRTISDNTFDILALVALDIKTIAYIPMSAKILQSIHLRTPDNISVHSNRLRGNIDTFPITNAIAELTK